MEVSEGIEVEPGGQELLQTVVTLTGLPEQWIRNELDQILEQSGQSSSDVTLDTLREAMAAYLESMQAEFIDESITT
jgi:hypothetical protein